AGRAAVDSPPSDGRDIVYAAGLAERTRVHDTPIGVVCRLAGPHQEGLCPAGPPGIDRDQAAGVRAVPRLGRGPARADTWRVRVPRERDRLRSRTELLGRRGLRLRPLPR